MLAVGAVAYVRVDRARLQRQIAHRHAAYGVCIRSWRDGEAGARALADCSWQPLSTIRLADVLGLPFLFVGLVLFLLLALLVRTPEHAPGNAGSG